MQDNLIPSDLDNPIAVVTISGDEGSGKSYAMKYISDKLKSKDINVLKVEEDTTPLFDDKTRSYDAFCKLPASVREERSRLILNERRRNEIQALKSCFIFGKGKPNVIIIDRPWWDSMYYSLRRTEDCKGEEFSVFKLMESLYMEGPSVYYPPTLNLNIHLSPLSDKLLKSVSKQDTTERSSLATKSSFNARVKRMANYVDYTLFYIMMNSSTVYAGHYVQSPVYFFETTLKEVRAHSDIDEVGAIGDDSFISQLPEYLEGLKALKALTLALDDKTEISFSDVDKVKEILWPIYEKILFVSSFESRNLKLDQCTSQLMSYIDNRIKEQSLISLSSKEDTKEVDAAKSWPKDAPVVGMGSTAKKLVIN
jgi:hypothetical protein